MERPSGYCIGDDDFSSVAYFEALTRVEELFLRNMDFDAVTLKRLQQEYKHKNRNKQPLYSIDK